MVADATHSAPSTSLRVITPWQQLTQQTTIKMRRHNQPSRLVEYQQMVYANQMINSSMKIIVLLAGLAGCVSAASASDLPDCVGDDSDNWKNCFGTESWGADEKYVGEFKDGFQSGQGTYTWPDGTKYVGEFKDSFPNGQGTYTYADGATYVGEFKDSDFNGQGTYTSTDRTIREGIWKDDKFLGTVAEVERAERARIAAEEEYKRIYNACLLDKGPDVDMSVSSVEKAVEATCASIAKDPSFLDGLRYD